MGAILTDRLPMTVCHDRRQRRRFFHVVVHTSNEPNIETLRLFGLAKAPSGAD